MLSIEPDRISVEPGGQSQVVVTIANPGTIVEGFHIDVVDEVSGRAGGLEGPAQWSEVIPPDGTSRTPDGSVVVSVYPQQRQSVVVVFSPPSGPHTPGGVSAFGVRVVSVVDPSASAVVEGDVELGQVFGLQAKLVPVTSAGRWRGGHVIQLSNWGNAPARLRLVASDPDQALGFLVRPEIVDLPLGSTLSARISVRTKRPKLRGNVARLPFSVVGERDMPRAVAAPASPLTTPDQPKVDGAFTQKPIVSRTVVMGAALLGLAAVALVGVSLRPASAEKSFEEEGVPPTPVIERAVASGPEKIRLSWRVLNRVEGYKLFQIGISGAPAATEDLDKAIGEKTVEDLESDTEYCFRLQAFRGDLPGPESNKVCARTAQASVPKVKPGPSKDTDGTKPSVPGPSKDTDGTKPSKSRPPSPERREKSSKLAKFAGNEWIAAVFFVPGQQARPMETAEARVKELVKIGVDAKQLNTADYPQLLPKLATDGWYVYIGPFDSDAKALLECDRVRSEHPDVTKGAFDCVARRPSPSPETQPSPSTQTP